MGLGAGSGVDAGTGTLTGLAGSEGWRGAGAAVVAGRGAGDDVAGAAVESCDGVDGAGAGDAAADAATALALACAIRSAALASAFLRISILASSCLIFLTQSCTSPGLRERDWVMSDSGSSTRRVLT